MTNYVQNKGVKMPVCYVYLIECKSVKPYPIKIGVATCPEKRIAELQTGCPYPLRLVSSIPFDSRGLAYEFESFSHSYFNYCRLSGEWFDSRKLKINKAMQKWDSIKSKGDPIKKKSHRIENTHGSKLETENARLKLKNWQLKDKIEKLQQDIDGYLDSKIDLYL